eukprot:m.301890 g.301890  ORF g.301890 m.301890 type:complete len:218 (-) comp14954_c0_seq1:586-1239(-)
MAPEIARTYVCEPIAPPKTPTKLRRIPSVSSDDDSEFEMSPPSPILCRSPPSSPGPEEEPSSPSSPGASLDIPGMQRTKLSTRQIKHALPSWMFDELIDPTAERRPRKTRRGSRQNKKNRQREALMSFAAAPVMSSTTSLTKCIGALPVELQSCFNEWRRERKEAILHNDVVRQQDLERTMWSALRNIVTQMQPCASPEMVDWEQHDAYAQYGLVSC